jgi:transcriptional regulator with XRE-family HTH domain
MEINKLISDRRKELGLTLEEVGKIVGVSKSTVKKWEDGFISNMKRDKIALLSKALKLNPVVLITGEDNINNEQNNNLLLSEHEKQLILAYRSRPDMQNAVDTLLNVPSLIEVKSVARSSDYHKPYKETITAEQLELLQSQEQPSSDDDL